MLGRGCAELLAEAPKPGHTSSGVRLFVRAFVCMRVHVLCSHVCKLGYTSLCEFHHILILVINKGELNTRGSARAHRPTSHIYSVASGFDFSFCPSTPEGISSGG